MKRETILPILRRLARAGHLPEDGPTSVFLRPSRQLSVRAEGDRVLVRASRLPFARPMVFTREEIEAPEGAPDGGDAGNAGA